RALRACRGAPVPGCGATGRRVAGACGAETAGPASLLVRRADGGDAVQAGDRDQCLDRARLLDDKPQLRGRRDGEQGPHCRAVAIGDFRQIDGDRVRAVRGLGHQVLELVDVGQVDVAYRGHDGLVLAVAGCQPELNVGHQCSSLSISTVVPWPVAVISTESTRAFINAMPWPRSAVARDDWCHCPSSVTASASPRLVSCAVTVSSTSWATPRVACSVALAAASPTANRTSSAVSVLTAAAGSQRRR